ncbi:hypothetical protein SVIOM342S_08894 [Streptomyces violaceorubidus]
MSADHRRDRKKKRLLVYGVASAVAVAATAGGLALASPGLLGGDQAQAAVAPGARLQSEFEQAAEEFDVPQSVLMAVSYRQTRWEDHDGLPSTTGAYNVMGLTDVDADSLENDGAAEEREHRLEHMNRSGDPVVEKHFDADKALKSLDEEPVDTDDPRLHTLDEAAGLIDASAEKVQSDTGGASGPAPRCWPSTRRTRPVRCPRTPAPGTRRWPAPVRPPTPRARSSSRSACSSRSRPVSSASPPTASRSACRPTRR